jgi:CheY-like chemotaxis protein
MDVNMPVLNGIQALKILRQNSQLNHIPVIMLTSEQDIATVSEILTLGITDYIVKDNVAEIENRLENYLNLM